MPTFLLVLLSILLSVIAQFQLRQGAVRLSVLHTEAAPGLDRLLGAAVTNSHLLVGFALYFAGALVWLVVLSRWEVSKAYPLVGLGFALSSLIGWMLGESVSPQRVMGVATICLGIWLLARS